MTWRSDAARRIAAVVASPAFKAATSDCERRGILSDAYPYGQRAMLPYKVWCEEVNRALTGDPHPQAAAKRRDAMDADSLWKP